jgi:hypothetical protein
VICWLDTIGDRKIAIGWSDDWRGDIDEGRTAEWTKKQEIVNQSDKKRKRKQGDKNLKKIDGSTSKARGNE